MTFYVLDAPPTWDEPWGVTVNGTTYNTSGQNITIERPNGTYSVSFRAPPGFAAPGNDSF